jgi:hypothetical protein
MGSKRIIAIVCVVFALIAAALLLRSGKEAAPTPAAESESAALSSTQPAPAPETPAPEPAPAPIVPTGPAIQEPDRVLVRADNVLATVNGVAVEGRDVLLFGSAGQPEQELEPESYKALLDRAIERELIVQAAEARGITLQADQEAQLDQVRRTVMAREGGDPNARYMNVQGTLEEQAAFEVKSAQAMLLRNAMLAQAGHALPYVTEEQVRGHYEAHAGQYGALPEDPAERAAAWQKIDFQIRNELSPKLQAEYQSQVDGFMQSLRQDAKIDVAPGPQP